VLFEIPNPNRAVVELAAGQVIVLHSRPPQRRAASKQLINSPTLLSVTRATVAHGHGGIVLVDAMLIPDAGSQVSIPAPLRPGYFSYTCLNLMNAQTAIPAFDYDSVELRSGRLHRIRRAEARTFGDRDGMVGVAKCYCRSHDVLTAADAEMQTRPSFVFPVEYFADLENLIGKELEGRIYTDSKQRRVRFFLDLREHAGFQFDEGNRDLQSPWYDDTILKE
jgi:hypothetical protein